MSFSYAHDGKTDGIKPFVFSSRTTFRPQRTKLPLKRVDDYFT
jgi:hypothetical protein